MASHPAGIVQVLRRAPIFSGLEEADLEAIALTVSVREVPKGGSLFAEGDEAKGFFLCAEGKLKVFKASPDGREQILHFIFPGETLAEVALFAGRAYPASAQALEPSKVVFVPREGLVRLARKRPDLSFKLLAGSALWVRRLTDLIAEYAKAVPARLAGYLLAEALRQRPTALADGARVRLAVNKGELAAHLGTVAETLSRAFAKLRDDGLIDVEEREITIKDLTALRDLASGP
jgi:CRP/FNR family transcriptional regulator, dissimilatory nitrate respiration regulator